MQRQLSVILVMLLCLSACQQRYWHVKRVKTDKTRIARNKEREKVIKDSLNLVRFADSSIHELPVQAENKIELTVPDRPTQPESVQEDEIDPVQKSDLREYFQKVLPDKPENSPREGPISKRELFYILSVFTIWILLIVFIPGYLILEIMGSLFFGGLLFGFSPMILVYFLLGGLALILVSWLAYIIGWNQLKTRKEMTIPNASLTTIFLLVFLTLAVFHALSIPGLVLIGLSLIAAIVYTIYYVRTS